MSLKDKSVAVRVTSFMIRIAEDCGRKLCISLVAGTIGDFVSVVLDEVPALRIRAPRF